MTRPISPNAEAAKRRLASDQPWYWLYQIEVPTTPPTRLRLVSSLDGASSGVTFGESSAGVAIAYSPFPITHSSPKEDTEASLGDMTIGIGNVSRTVQFYVDNYDMVGQLVVVTCVLRADLQAGVPTLEDRFEIIAVESNAKAVSLRVGRPNILREPFPLELAMRDACRFQYRGARCGYVGAALPTCDKTLNGANGCTVHGAQEVTEGLTQTHPARIGAFPGMPVE